MKITDQIENPENFAKRDGLLGDILIFVGFIFSIAGVVGSFGYAIYLHNTESEGVLAWVIIGVLSIISFKIISNIMDRSVYANMVGLMSETGQIPGCGSALETPLQRPGDGDFDNYLRHTEPLSGAVQDADLAREYLEKAVEKNHPDANFVLGALKYTGDGYPQDGDEGLSLMKKGKELGADEIADVMAEVLGVDLNSDGNQSFVQIEDELISGRLAVACQEKIDSLFANGDLNAEQRDDLREVIRSVDPTHLINVRGALSNKSELEKLKSHSSRITGWDADAAIFYISPANDSGN